MSNYNSLKTTIDANIKQNGNQEISGQILNSVLNQMVTTLGAGYQFAGVATTATNPGSPDAKVFYIANGKGKYEKFDGINVTEDDVVVLYWDSSWHKVSTGIASNEKLTELESEFDKIGAEPSVNVWKGKRSYNFTNSLLLGELGVELYPSGTYTLSLVFVGSGTLNLNGYYNTSQIVSANFASGARKSATFTISVPLERLFFQASGECTISDIQIEIGSVATPYTTPLAVTDFNAQDRLNKIEGITNAALLYSEQNLNENQQKQARINIASFGYNGSLQPTSIDDKTLPTGFFYMNQGGNLPIKRAGLLFVYNYANVFIEQRLIDLITNEEYVRTTGASETWTNWHGTWENYSNYKGSLNADNNVDEILSEGVWYLSTTYQRPQGNLPNGIQYGLLVEDSVGGGLSVQTITDLLSSERYTRVFKDAWSEWRLESDRLKDLLNMLPNTQGTQTINGITFDVQNDGAIKVYGTKTSGNSIYLIASVALEKGYYWLGGCPNANTSISMRVIRGDGSYKDMYLNNGDQYRIEVTEDVETISVYLFANTSIAESSPYIFRPMLCRIGSPTTNYQQYGIYKDWGKVNSYIPHSNFSWVGKKMVIKGDSIAEGKGACFANVVGQILRLSDVHNFGIGGSRMAYYGDGQNVTANMSVVATWDEMERDADIVYIHAGTNDWASQVPLGDPTSTNKMEFNGALNIIMSGLRAKYPAALIIFDTILPRVNYDADNNSGMPTPIKTSAYSQAIKDRCADHHIVCNDVYESCGLDFEYDYNNGIYATTADGLHPNTKGAEILGRKIAGFINSH